MTEYTDKAHAVIEAIGTHPSNPDDPRIISSDEESAVLEIALALESQGTESFAEGRAAGDSEGFERGYAEGYENGSTGSTSEDDARLIAQLTKRLEVAGERIQVLTAELQVVRPELNRWLAFRAFGWEEWQKEYLLRQPAPEPTPDAG